MNKTSENPRLTSKFQNKTHKKHQFIYQIAAIAHWIHTSLWHKLCCFVAFIHRRAYKHCKKCQNIPRGSFQNISNIYMKNRMKLTLFSTKIFYINRYLCIKSFKISINFIVTIFKSQKCISSQKSMQCSLFYIQFTVTSSKEVLFEWITKGMSNTNCMYGTPCVWCFVYYTIPYQHHDRIYIFTTTLTLLCASSLYRMHIAHVTAALALTLPLFCCNRKTRKCFFPV